MASHRRNPLPVVVVLVSLLLLAATQVHANNPNGKTPWALQNSNLQSRLQQWTRDPDGVSREHGVIGSWDLRNVTSLRNVFGFNEKFNADISGWNVSGVTDFSSMFWEASGFDGYLGNWDVSSAETMSCMFCGAKKFTGKGLDQWKDKLGNVKDMFNMFEGTALTADLSEWRVESVTNFRNMFMDTPQYSQQLCWNVSIGARTDQMFNGTPACLDKKCVIEEIYKESGCSAAPSWMAVPSTWAIMAATGLMGLMVQQF